MLEFMFRSQSAVAIFFLAAAVVGSPESIFAQTNYYAGTVTGQSPVGYWRLNETTGTTATAAVGGVGLDGTYINFGGSNPALDQQGPRPATFPGFLSTNVAKQFNGNTSTTQNTTAYTRVEVADQSSLDITGALTISAWINPTSFSTLNRGIVAKWRLALANDTSVAERAYGFSVDASGKLQFVLSDSGTFNSNFQLTGSTTVSTNAWQHVTAVYEPGVAMRIYLNGVLDGQKTTTLPAFIANTAAPLWIGQQANLSGQTAFIGRIDESAVFNSALSAQAVRTQYTAGVFSGTSTWKTAGSGAWGSGHATAWTSGTFNGSEVNAAPGTFAGVTNADTAIFGNAVASGTATISLDGAAVSLRTLTFSNTSARYRIVTGTGNGSFMLAAPTGKPVIDVAGIHEIAVGISGSNGLQKTGIGTLILSGSSGFSGGTDLAAGTLLVNGTLGGALDVASGATLGGAGSVLGTVSVLSGGTFSPGNSPGIFSAEALTLAGSTLMEIDGTAGAGVAGGHDLANVSGLLTYGGLLQIDFGAGITSAFLDNTSFNLFDFGSQTGFFDAITTAADGSFYGGLTFTGSGDVRRATATNGQTLEFTYSSGNLVIVPEPSAWLLACGGAAAAAGFCRRRARRFRAAP
jgi:fibronectin-binding autotransporter adhesin